MQFTCAPSVSIRRDPASQTSKVAIVTGASSGIGLESAKTLISRGYRVIANSRSITSSGTLQATYDLKLVDGDIATQKLAERVVTTAMQEFGRIDLLVNNAGIFISNPSRTIVRTTFGGCTKPTSRDSSMFRSSRWRRCAFRNRDMSSTSRHHSPINR